MSMSAQIVARIGPEPDRLDLGGTLGKLAPARVEGWIGASGQRYTHLVYGLIDCPVVPKANYVLIHRERDGRREVLKVGRASHEAPTLNLAQIRHEGALLGANEIHVCIVAKTEAERILAEFDIVAGMRVDGEPMQTLVVRH